LRKRGEGKEGPGKGSSVSKRKAEEWDTGNGVDVISPDRTELASQTFNLIDAVDGTKVTNF